MGISPRTAGALALLALVPAVTYGFVSNAYAGVVTATNVLLISLSIYLLMSPTEGGHGHGHGDHDDGESAV